MLFSIAPIFCKSNMIHLEIETNSGKLVIQQVVSYIDSEDCFMLLHFDKDNLVGKPIHIFSSLHDAKEYIKDERNCLLC